MGLLDNIEWGKMTNNEISKTLLDLQDEHTAVKSKILALMDEMDNIEQAFSKGEATLEERIKPKI